MERNEKRLSPLPAKASQASLLEVHINDPGGQSGTAQTRECFGPRDGELKASEVRHLGPTTTTPTPTPTTTTTTTTTSKNHRHQRQKFVIPIVIPVLFTSSSE